MRSVQKSDAAAVLPLYVKKLGISMFKGGGTGALIG